MTSVKSSADTFRFTFLRTLRKCWLIPLALFALLMSQYAAIFTLIDEFNYNVEYTRGFVAEDFMAQYKFVLMNQSATDYGFGSMLIQAALIGSGVLLAIQIFKFVASKKMVNVYYSLGVTRANLFVSKYLAGAVVLLLAISVPFIVSVCGNVLFFGGSHELYISALGYFLNYIVICFFCYNVTAIVMSCMGSVLEAAIYSGILLLMPSIVSYAIEKLMLVFLYGAPFSGIYSVVGVGSIRPSALTDKTYLNPISPLISGEDTRSYSYMLNDITDKTSFEWVAPSFKYAIIWGTITVILFAVSIVVFKKRRAELSGFLGVNKAITAFCTFIAGLFAGVYLVNNYANISKPMVFVVGFCAMLAAYSVAQLVLFRSFKGYLKKLWHVVFYFAAFAACCLVFITGLFGYSGKIPEMSEIKSVAVSTGTGNSLVEPNSSNIEDFGFFYGNEEVEDIGAIRIMSRITLSNYSSTTFPGFNNKQDIETVRKVHKMLVDQKGLKVNEKTAVADDYMQRAVDTPIVISYELTNGKTVLRRYESTTYEVLAILASLQNSDAYRDYAADMIESGIFDETKADENRKQTNSYSIFNDESCAIGLLSGNLLRKTPLDELKFGSELRNAMLKAYCDDIRAGRGHLDLLTDSQPIGYIYFYYSGDKTLFVTTDSDGSYEINGDAVPTFSVWNYNGHGIPVYSDMTETIQFLTKNNLISLLSDSMMPVKISICRLGENGPVNANEIDAKLNGQTSQIAGSVYYDEGEKMIPADVIEFKEAADIAKIASNVLYTGSCAQDGWYAALTYANGSVAFGFLPSQYLPSK